MNRLQILGPLVAGVTALSPIVANADDVGKRIDGIICTVPTTCKNPRIHSRLFENEYHIDLSCEREQKGVFDSFQLSLPFFPTNLMYAPDLEVSGKNLGMQSTKIIIDKNSSGSFFTCIPNFISNTHTNEK